LHGDVIEELTFSTSYDDFLDFINEGALSKGLFILGFLHKKNKCMQVGGYERNLQGRITTFISNKVDNVDLSGFENEEVFSDYDGDDNFVEYIERINARLQLSNMTIVVFFNDVYSACTYHIFIVEARLYKKILCEWKDKEIHLLNLN
jgi:hypothetical protein